MLCAEVYLCVLYGVVQGGTVWCVHGIVNHSEILCGLR